MDMDLQATPSTSLNEQVAALARAQHAPRWRRILLAVAVLAIAVGGLWFSRQESRDRGEVLVVEVPSSTPIEWKVYANAQYGFEISIPAAWGVVSSGSVLYLESPETKGRAISDVTAVIQADARKIYKGVGTASLKEYVARLPGDRKEALVFQGAPAWAYVYRGVGVETKVIIMESKNTLYSLMQNAFDGSPLIAQVVSTFRLTK